MATLSSAECRNQCRVVDKLKSAATASARLQQSRLWLVAAAKSELGGTVWWLVGVLVSLPHCSWLALQDLLLSERWAPRNGQDLCSVSCGRGNSCESNVL